MKHSWRSVGQPPQGCTECSNQVVIIYDLGLIGEISSVVCKRRARIAHDMRCGCPVVFACFLNINGCLSVCFLVCRNDNALRIASGSFRSGSKCCRAEETVRLKLSAAATIRRLDQIRGWRTQTLSDWTLPKVRHSPIISLNTPEPKQVIPSTACPVQCCTASHSRTPAPASPSSYTSAAHHFLPPLIASSLH